MARYKHERNETIRDTERGVNFPADENNRDYQEYLASGETADPADPEPVPSRAERRRAKYRRLIKMDEVHEALFEDKLGDPTKMNALIAIRQTIRDQEQ